jgi:hypothetical protein
MEAPRTGRAGDDVTLGAATRAKLDAAPRHA